MALNQVRTQVLLLHSEQTTLDRLSSGLDDRYTVHCATSGTEALNFLGDTPIHVIVSAKDLPGMSGVEALREAKKRSPETIGILLAGDNDKGLEALVSDKEVFQIVRGGIDPQDLTKLIDNATRQMRLLALAESANDVAANPDEPAEHIVMETSENGSTIISGGTGNVPVLDPRKVASAVSAGSRSVDVLVLTKDEEFLATVKESTRGMHTIHHANTLAQAEAAMAKHKVGVAVVDAAMVGDKVEKLTQHLRHKKERLVNIVAGRRDDGEMLMDLINRGKVYRFLLKPVSPGRARLAIEASVKHHLEAPEAAFNPANSAAASSGTSAASKATASASSPAPTPIDKSAKKAAKAKTDEAAGDSAANYGSGLASAFDGDDASFTETMTGIVSNLGKAFSKKKPAAEKVETTSESKSAAVQATPKRESRKTPPPAKAPAEPAPAKADNPLRASHSLGTSQTLRPAMDDRLNTSFGESGGGSSIWSNPKILGAGAAAIVAVLAIGFWIFSGGDEEAPVARKTASTSQASVTETEIANTGRPRQTSASPGAAADLLAEAQLAEQAGQIFNPPGSNAIELYAAAREAAPDNAEIAEKFSAVLGLALSQAESAMLERRADDAAAALDRVALVDPQNSRLPFLTAQLSQMQMRNYVDTARTAIRESRFEDAANAISAANLLDVTDRTDLATVADELSAARSAQQVDDVLAAAADRLEQGKLTAPSNDNARYFYELVLSNQPDNTAAQQGLTAVASKLVLQARAEIDQGRFDRASALLDDARVLDPSSSEVSDATEALEESRARVAAEQRQREAQQRAAEQREQDRLLAEQQAEAERRAAAVEAARSTKDTEEDTVADNAAETVTTAVAGTAASTSPDPTAPRSRPPVERPQATEPEGPVAISSLTRIKYVAPKYPRAAERRELSGWVDVVFTVALDGTTRDIQVRDSDPGDMFVDSAVRAIERWEFEPVLENGAPVEKTAGVRMMFALE